MGFPLDSLRTVFQVSGGGEYHLVGPGSRARCGATVAGGIVRYISAGQLAAGLERWGWCGDCVERWGPIEVEQVLVFRWAEPRGGQ